MTITIDGGGEHTHRGTHGPVNLAAEPERRPDTATA